MKAQHPKGKKRGLKISRKGAPYGPEKALETGDKPERRKTVRANHSGKLHKAHTPDNAVRSAKEFSRDDKGGNTVEMKSRFLPRPSGKRPKKNCRSFSRRQQAKITH
ncbi:hypothetical protein RAM19_11550 [Bartonella apihabitans]|nr:hypothetical protein [Bartonella apihabitans]WLT08615.1 hypothetical protein RAM19_11550 [Bartonella apihabitans]